MVILLIVFLKVVTMANKWLSAKLPKDFKTYRLMELIKANDKVSIPINQDNCSAGQWRTES